MKTIVITGGSGFIGTGIIRALLDRGYQVRNLDKVPSRITDVRVENQIIDVTRDILDPAWFDGAYGVINLMGVSIFGRWTEAYRTSLIESRVTATEKIVTAMRATRVNPSVLVSASAIGYYGGHTEPVWKTESDEPGTDFLAQLCNDWEQSALRAESVRTRVVIVRTAHVIGKGGLLGVLFPLFRFWIGGYFGSGNQGMPWIDWRDVVNWYVYAVEHTTVSEVYNVAAGSVSQKTFMQTIARIVGQRWVWKIPLIAVRLIYKGFADTLATGVYVDNQKITSLGILEHVDLEQSIRDANKKVD